MSNARSWRVNFHSNGLADLLVAALKRSEACFDLGEVGKVVGCKHLSLYNGEVDLVPG